MPDKPALRRRRPLPATYSDRPDASTPDGLLPQRHPQPPAAGQPVGRPAARNWPAGRPAQRLLSGLLGLPEDLADLVDLGKELVGGGDVGAALRAAGARQLRGLVEELVQLRVLLEVRRLEIVGPQHPQMVLDQVRPLLL